MYQRMYRVEWVPETADDQWTGWAGSVREARELSAGRTGVAISPVEVPRNSAGLLQFLNEEAARRPPLPVNHHKSDSDRAPQDRDGGGETRRLSRAVG